MRANLLAIVCARIKLLSYSQMKQTKTKARWDAGTAVSIVQYNH